MKKTAYQRKFAAAAKSCKGKKGKRVFRSCMAKKLKKK